MSGPTIFISYSHKDEKWKNRLVKHLGVLHNQDLLELWDDRQIVAGQEWSQEIQKAMDRASIAILLISAHSLTSRFILHEEVKCLLERRNEEGLPIFPVIVSPCDYEAVAWLHRMQLRPTDGRPLSRGRNHQIDSDLSEITKEVRSLLDSSVRPSQASYPIAPHNKGGIATETGTASIEITINRDFKLYSKDEQDKLLRAIADVLDITGDVRVIRKCPAA